MNFEDMQLKINGVPLPAPVDFDVELYDLDDESSGRDVKSMKLERNRIRANLYKIRLGYALDTPDSISLILDLISDETFEVELYDIITKERVKKTMHSGPKHMGFIFNHNMWIKGFKFNLIEV